MEIINDWQGRNFSYFQNGQCECFPCHKTDNTGDFNCLFCFCPLYGVKDCGGKHTYSENGRKDCCGCILPHKRDNYGFIIEKLNIISLEEVKCRK